MRKVFLLSSNHVIEILCNLLSSSTSQKIGYLYAELDFAICHAGGYEQFNW